MSDQILKVHFNYGYAVVEDCVVWFTFSPSSREITRIKVASGSEFVRLADSAREKRFTRWIQELLGQPG